MADHRMNANQRNDKVQQKDEHWQLYALLECRKGHGSQLCVQTAFCMHLQRIT